MAKKRKGRRLGKSKMMYCSRGYFQGGKTAEVCAEYREWTNDAIEILAKAVRR